MRRSIAAFAAMLLMCPAVTKESQGDLRFILLTPFVNYPFFEPIRKGAQDAALSMGVKVTFDGTLDGDVKALANRVRQAMDAGYEGIALSIVDPIAFDEVAVEAARKQVPLIAFNVDDSRTPNVRLAFVGQNMLQAGRAFGKEVAAFAPANSHILLTMHDPNIAALEDRSQGIKEMLTPLSIRWTELITSTNREQAVERIYSSLKANPTIKIILGTGSADTEAAGLAIEKYFPEQGYISAGFDLNPEILRLIRLGIIRLSVDQKPYSQGYLSVVALALYRRYGLMPPNVDTGATMITADHVNEVLELSRQHFR